ncbi:hypothetical protein EU537_03165 [Candidatus Thorarchaeota archaeon]|nr:MAG: hypothetical protein EU537_03165 [Candidatus Thorarchaeota archaeon]
MDPEALILNTPTQDILSMKLTTHYFKEASPEHTERTLDYVEEFLSEHPEIEHVLVASTQGDTGLAASRKFSNHKCVVVSHQTGFVMDNENEMQESIRKEIEKNGASVLTCTHAFAGVDRGIRKQFGTWTTAEFFAVVYRTFGQGTKVCAEIALMAADAGLVPVDADVVTIAGTGRGADTAWVVQPANTNKFPELRMRGCIVKPLDF